MFNLIKKLRILLYGDYDKLEQLNKELKQLNIKSTERIINAYIVELAALKEQNKALKSQNMLLKKQNNLLMQECNLLKNND